ncbi:hypothetical protein D3C87_1151730 [compost metagenome]
MYTLPFGKLGSPNPMARANVAKTELLFTPIPPIGYGRGPPFQDWLMATAACFPEAQISIAAASLKFPESCTSVVGSNAI